MNDENWMEKSKSVEANKWITFCLLFNRMQARAFDKQHKYKLKVFLAFVALSGGGSSFMELHASGRGELQLPSSIPARVKIIYLRQFWKLQLVDYKTNLRSVGVEDLFWPSPWKFNCWIRTGSVQFQIWSQWNMTKPKLNEKFMKNYSLYATHGQFIITENWATCMAANDGDDIQLWRIVRVSNIMQ